jgi:lipopolysaccharide export system protein LptA
MLADQDGGEYRGSRMIYDRQRGRATLFGTVAQPAQVKLIAEDANGQAPQPGAPVRHHLIHAPQIDFERESGYIHAYSSGESAEFGVVDGVFWPGEGERNMLEPSRNDGNPDTPREVRPWRLICSDLEAWLDRSEKRQQRGGVGKILRVEATGNPDRRLTIQSVLPEDARTGSQTATGARFSHKKRPEGGPLTQLFGDERGNAELTSDRETLSAGEIQFLHIEERVLCPGGGTTEFIEQVEGQPARRVRISCVGPIHFKPRRQATFTERVKIERELSTLYADQVVADLAEDGSGQGQIKRSVCTGSVRIISSGDTAYGDRADWGATTRMMILTANPGKKVRIERGGEVFLAPEVHFDQATGKATTPKGFEKIR